MENYEVRSQHILVLCTMMNILALGATAMTGYGYFVLGGLPQASLDMLPFIIPLSFVWIIIQIPLCYKPKEGEWKLTTFIIPVLVIGIVSFRIAQELVKHIEVI